MLINFLGKCEGDNTREISNRILDNDWDSDIVAKVVTTQTPTTIAQTTRRLAYETTTRNEPGECKDNNANCKVWATAHMCRRNPYAMNSLCPLTCQICQPPTTAAISQAKPEDSQADSNCVDKSKMCHLWYTAGHCRSSASYMQERCPRSCRLCADQKERPECKDQNRFCVTWAKRKRCHAYEGYMKTVCPKSCNLCADKEKTTSPNCKDENSYCEKWAKKGYCKIRMDFMGKKCKKACNLCY